MTEGIENLAEPGGLTLRYVEFDPLGWQVWSNDKGYQIAGFAMRDGLLLYLKAREESYRGLVKGETP